MVVWLFLALVLTQSFTASLASIFAARRIGPATVDIMVTLKLLLVKRYIAAAYLEVPCIKVFLAKHCKGFTNSGPTYRAGGSGFVFPRSFPYLLDISEAVVEVAESGALKDLDNSLTSSYKCLASESDDHTDRLRLSSFRGLFGITVGTSTIVLLLYCTCPREKIRTTPEEAAADEPPGPAASATGRAATAAAT
ncbi:hypothetical protein NC651_030711 [Populus alba x Populus x berolinensis]|nr:hypothetical protein NC651_030711 [Populus alba x Populus x berolinensis]